VQQYVLKRSLVQLLLCRLNPQAPANGTLEPLIGGQGFAPSGSRAEPLVRNQWGEAPSPEAETL